MRGSLLWLWRRRTGMKRKRRKKCRSLQGDSKSSIHHGTSAGFDDGSPSDSIRAPHMQSPQMVLETTQPLLDPLPPLLEDPELVLTGLDMLLDPAGGLFDAPKMLLESAELNLEPQQPLVEAPESSLQSTTQLMLAPEPLLESKHKIFMSHSGANKKFTWELCEELERVHHFPFFDKREDSLPKGEKFPPLIMKAAKECRVAILVLSEEFFTRSKWPMIELNAFVEAQQSNNTGLKILPLFLGLTMQQFNEKERRENWLKEWQDMSMDDGRIIVKDWQHALSRIPGGINAMEYNGPSEGHVAFRKKVVAAVCKLVRPDVQWDESHVQSMDMLSKPILLRMKEIEPSEKYKVRVVGLYGMGGAGKTTISNVVCNQMLGDLCGKACHVEFGSMNSMEMRKRILRELTDASPEILNVALGQLADLLKKRMRRQKVFLALDNI